MTPQEPTDDEGPAIFGAIDITPLTDVFLVMLVIFMVSALAAQAERDKATRDDARVEVRLPPGASRDLDPAQRTLVLDVLPSGNVLVGTRRIADTALEPLFRAAVARDRETQLILRADQSVPHGRVVRLMDRARRAGIAKLAIGTAGE